MEKENRVHVEYVIHKPDGREGETMPTLEVIDPMAFVVALRNFDDETLNALQHRLNTKFQYSDGEVIPLQITNSPYSFLMFKESVGDKRSLGCVWSDRNGGRDGHETEVIVDIEEFCNELNIQRGIDPENDDIGAEGSLTLSTIYRNECIPNGSGYYLVMVEEGYNDTSDNEDENGNWYIEIRLVNNNISIGLHVIKERCIPYTEN